MSQDSAEKQAVLSGKYALLLALAAVSLGAYYFSYVLRGDAPRPHARQLLTLCFLAIAARPFCEAAEFRLVFLSVSVLGLGAWAGLDSIGIFAFAALVILASRSRLPVALRVALVVAAWAAPVLSRFWLDPALLAPHQLLFVYWAGIPFSALYLVVERARGSLEDAKWTDDALYLLALPRLASPFFQAIPASTFLRSQVERAPLPKLALRGAGLLLYGTALFVLIAKFPYIQPPRPDVHVTTEMTSPLRGPHNFVFVYAFNASAIFCAVGMLRLLGFDLSSGFRWPLLSTSFAEFYRRWNHYVYDTVKSLFLFPLLGRLRVVLPDAVAAVVSGYVAIFFGSYCLSTVLVPLALDPRPHLVLERAFSPHQFLILGVFWTLILVPQLLPSIARRTSNPTKRGQLVQRVIFIVLLALITSAASALGVILV